MLTPIRPENQHVKAEETLPVAPADPGRIAVLLNRNARKVTDRLAKHMEHIVGTDHMFYSRSLEEAEALTREIVQRGYGTVICGGGDGTLAQAINLIRGYVKESNQWRRERFQRFGERQNLLQIPRFAFLRLGTGNGIQPIVGAGKPVEDLQNIIDFAPGRTYSIPLIENENEVFFFGGMGYDSMLLNDYNGLKQRTHNFLLKPIMHSVIGYFVAGLSRTLPRLLFSKKNKIEARVVNRGNAYYVDPRRGDSVIPIEKGATLFEGDARIIAAGSIPFYGYGFKIFPFAGMQPKMMHLRVATIGPMRTLSHFPSIWRGNYRNFRSVHDFLVEDVDIELARPFPWQHSGEAKGMQDRIPLKIAEEQLRLVDYHTQRRLV